MSNRVIYLVVFVALGYAFFLNQGDRIRSALERAQSQKQIEQSAAGNWQSVPASQYGIVSLNKMPDGHFWADSLVNGVHLRFLVDTGASAISIAKDDARRLGFDLSPYQFVGQAQTAAGVVKVAPVVFQSITIGDITLKDVPGGIRDQETGTALLGMTFLSRLSGLNYQGNQLILKQ